jgi:DNA-binding MarR family transcriptional regulator
MVEHTELPDDDALPLLLRSCMVHLVKGDEAMLTLQQLGALLICCSHPDPLPVHAVTKKLKVNSFGIGRVGDALATLGFLEKRPNPDDGRSVLLVPTEKGRAVCRRLAGGSE